MKKLFSKVSRYLVVKWNRFVMLGGFELLVDASKILTIICLFMTGFYLLNVSKAFIPLAIVSVVMLGITSLLDYFYKKASK